MAVTVEFLQIKLTSKTGAYITLPILDLTNAPWAKPVENDINPRVFPPQEDKVYIFNKIDDGFLFALNEMGNTGDWYNSNGNVLKFNATSSHNPNYKWVIIDNTATAGGTNYLTAHIKGYPEKKENKNLVPPYIWNEFYFFVKYKDKYHLAYLESWNYNTQQSLWVWNKDPKINPLVTNFFKGGLPPVPPPPPEPYGPESKPGGGEGDFDDSSTDIITPDVPNKDFNALTFVRMYQPSSDDLGSLARYLWSDDFLTNFAKKLTQDPLQLIIGLAVLPTSNVGGVEDFKLGSVVFKYSDGTPIKVPTVKNQYKQISCGVLKINEFFGSFLDYAPYTNINIYLPYIGYKQLDPNNVMNKNLEVKYNIDMLTGACIAYILSDGNVLYQFSGACSAQIPLTAVDKTGIVDATIKIAAATAAIGLVAGAIPAAAAAGVPSAVLASGSTGMSMANGVVLTGMGLSAANSALNSKPVYQHGGSIAGCSGYMGIQKPYLIIERPNQSLAHDYNKFAGYPSNITSELGKLTGYTQVQSIKLNGFKTATAAELVEIDRILKGGVIL